MQQERCDGCNKLTKCRLFTYPGKFGIVVRFYCRECSKKAVKRG